MMVRDALPPIINRPDKKDIHILKYERILLNTYVEVRQVSQELWDGTRDKFLPRTTPDEASKKADVDFILYLCPETRSDIYVETQARRDGYCELGLGRGYSHLLEDLGLPPVLSPEFDLHHITSVVSKVFPVSIAVSPR